MSFMDFNLLELLNTLIESKPLIYIVIIVASLILEDPSTFAVGYLISSEKLGFYEGLIPLFIGLYLGDLLLFLLGYFLKEKFLKSKKISSKIAVNNSLIFFARFVPGMRITIYPLAGYLKVSLWQFTLVNMVSGVIWTFLLLKFGNELFSQLGVWAWAVIVMIIIIFYFLEKAIRKKFLEGSGKEVLPDNSNDLGNL